ncbi:Glycerate kinase [Sporomusa ovata DSM 2662]|uniref:Glycerate kinase n=1 Tax=Sporomusa ovata TaxID=2378 RepID=A0A0U1L266_9FIRM|nr:glycerate kinase [Sporomusa ovata]EQB25209.1 glycerate kinase [Sporomusa ovata DSM 2662]CQR73770.1 Glycerate kinase [Sporomusa ovata]
MRIIVAPDSFKGSISAIDVANAMEQGILMVDPQANIKKVPIADGGEGTVEALVATTGGRIIRQSVMGPLGDRVEASWGILGDGETAVIEMAAASGLILVPKEKRNPLFTTTYGTGQLIRAALDRGLRKMIIGIGGSATNDGGAGMARALGAKFLNKDNSGLPQGGAALANLVKIDLSEFDPRLAETEIVVACDVDNPLCGPQGASAVYGPQKGASPEMVTELDQAMHHYAEIAKQATGKDVENLPGAGAAGGLGSGFMFFTNAKLRPGVEIVLDAAKFDDLMRNADLVITGEGCTDFQTSRGKAPIGVAKRASKYDVPTICLSGGLGVGHESVLLHGIWGVCSIVPQPITLDECMGRAESLVIEATARLLRLLRAGMVIGLKLEKSGVRRY